MEVRYIVTDNIEDKCINMISSFRDKAYVGAVVNKSCPKISSKRQEKVQNEISSYVSQGIDYYLATTADIKTAPLTLFYSILNFTRAIVYLKKSNEDLKGSHGLTTDNSSISMNSGIGDVVVKVDSKGTFMELICLMGDEIATQERILFKDVMSILPELLNEYEMVYHENPNVSLLQPMDKGYFSVLPRKYSESFSTRDEFESFINGCVEIVDCSFVGGNHIHTERYFDYLSKHIKLSVFKTEACREENIKRATYMDVYGNQYLNFGLPKAGKRVYISKISALYISYFVLSTLVRYNAGPWLHFCNSADSTLIRTLVVNMKKEMLVEVLQLLTDEKFVFVNSLPKPEKELNIRDLCERMIKELEHQKYISNRSPLEGLI